MLRIQVLVRAVGYPKLKVPQLLHWRSLLGGSFLRSRGITARRTGGAFLLGQLSIALPISCSAPSNTKRASPPKSKHAQSLLKALGQTFNDSDQDCKIDHLKSFISGDRGNGYHGTSEVRGKLCGAGLLRPPLIMIWGLNSGHQACPVTTLSVESALGP